MFRFFKPRTSILSMARYPLRIEQRIKNGEISRDNIYRVRAQKGPPKTWKRARNAAITTIFVYVGFIVWTNFILAPLEKELDGQELPEEEGDMSIFIPFPGTTREVKPKAYRGSDPEWKEFIKFSRDKELIAKVRNELANHVRLSAMNWPALALQYGKDMKLKRQWLDVDFPSHPSPEFERSGIEITDDEISWTTMPVESLTVFRIRNVLWPAPLVKSLWAALKVIVVDDAKRIGSRLGFDTGPPPPTKDQIIAQTQERIARLQGRLKNKNAPNQKVEAKEQNLPQPLGQDNKKAITPAEKTSNPKLAQQESEQAKAEDENQRLDPIAATRRMVQDHFFRGYLAFMQKYMQTAQPPRAYPPRGSILFQGFVEVEAPRAWLTFDVKAAWDPKTKTFDVPSLILQLRRLQLKNQGPLGGS